MRQAWAVASAIVLCASHTNVKAQELYPAGAIERIEALTKHSASYSYGGLGISSMCSQSADSKDIYLCVTRKDGVDTFPNAYLLINMSQKLMFILNKPSKASCSTDPVRVIALYDKSQKLTDKALPPSKWSESFAGMAKEYNYILGCEKEKSSYVFDSEPFGFNMRWRMPWEFNISNPDPLKSLGTNNNPDNSYPNTQNQQVRMKEARDTHYDSGADQFVRESAADRAFGKEGCITISTGWSSCN